MFYGANSRSKVPGSVNGDDVYSVNKLIEEDTLSSSIYSDFTLKQMYAASCVPIFS